MVRQYSRRGALAMVVGAGALAMGGAFRWYNPTARIGPGRLSAADAHAQAAAGTITLIDIRRPDEWAQTGVAGGAVPLDMRRPDFAERLAQVLEGDKTRPVALICARGVRSRAMVARLGRAGFTSVQDVPEGMMGSGAGPGWVARGLDVRRR